LTAYRITFVNKNTLNALNISLARSFIGTFSNMIFTSISAYALTVYQAPGIRFLRKYFIYVMYIGGGLIPTYLVVRYIGLVGSFWVYILPGLVSIFGMILTRTFIESLPRSLEESALIDGANEVQAFTHVVFPMCLPIVAALSMFTFIGHWNAYFDTMLYNFMDRKLYTLQYVLFMTLTSANITSLEMAKEVGLAGSQINPQTITMAITVISIIPIIFIFPFAQKYFRSGLLVGSIKA
jgi:putative aldouronate transport system permease protein